MKQFRSIHYLGSKYRLLTDLKRVVDDLDDQKNGLCDLFAGTGTVGHFFGSERKIVAGDVQNYSYIICKALLCGQKDVDLNFLSSIENNTTCYQHYDAFEKIINYENRLLTSTINEADQICNLVENGSLYAAQNGEHESNYSELTNLINEITLYIKNENLNDKLVVTRHYGGIYFSYLQALHIDAVLNSIKALAINERTIYLAALLSTASDLVNTVGKQFAQPIRPRNKNGIPKKGLSKRLSKDRDVSVMSKFTDWVKKYNEFSHKSEFNEIYCQDFRETLELLGDDVKVVYADPPYTRDHYSRFYHVLETISLMDDPVISTNKVRGVTKLSRGFYRNDRLQSEFCIRSKAPQAFEDLCRLVAKKNKHLIISYSPYDKSKGAHPRVVELEYLKNIATNYFRRVEVLPLGTLTHSKLNRSDLHLSAEESAEVVLICKS
jgi:adenine-specific DNA methylase